MPTYPTRKPKPRSRGGSFIPDTRRNIVPLPANDVNNRRRGARPKDVFRPRPVRGFGRAASKLAPSLAIRVGGYVVPRLVPGLGAALLVKDLWDIYQRMRPDPDGVIFPAGRWIKTHGPNTYAYTSAIWAQRDIIGDRAYRPLNPPFGPETARVSGQYRTRGSLHPPAWTSDWAHWRNHTTLGPRYAQIASWAKVKPDYVLQPGQVEAGPTVRPAPMPDPWADPLPGWLPQVNPHVVPPLAPVPHVGKAPEWVHRVLPAPPAPIAPIRGQPSLRPPVAPALPPSALPGRPPVVGDLSPIGGGQAVPRPGQPPHMRRPPRAGEKEVKGKAMRAFQIIGDALGGASEVNDIVNAAWKALPSKCKTRTFYKGRIVNSSWKKKHADLWRCAPHMSVNDFAWNYLENQIEDEVMGRLSGGANSNPVGRINGINRWMGIDGPMEPVETLQERREREKREREKRS